MKYYKTEIFEAVQRISMYPEEFSNLFIPVIEENVTAFEQAIGYKLPNDYKSLLSITNGLSFCSCKQFLSSEDKEAPAFKHIIGEKSPSDKYLLSFNNDLSLYAYMIVGIWSNLVMNVDDAEHEYDDLAYRYAIRHRKGEKPMPDYLVPFCPTQKGAMFCFDTRKPYHGGTSYPVVIREPKYEYTEERQPRITHNSFAEFFNDVFIGWTLSFYDYDRRTPIKILQPCNKKSLCTI